VDKVPSIFGDQRAAAPNWQPTIIIKKVSLEC